MSRPCIPDKQAPSPPVCPRCESYPFDPDGGCDYCGLGRAYPVPPGLDPACDVAQGWASGWPNDRPPTPDQVARFVDRHGAHCRVCWRYRRWWRRLLHALRRRLVEAASSPQPKPNKGGA